MGMKIGTGSMENSKKVPQKTELLYDPAIPLLGIYSHKTIFQKDIHTLIFILALFQWPRHENNLNVH